MAYNGTQYFGSENPDSCGTIMSSSSCSMQRRTFINNQVATMTGALSATNVRNMVVVKEEPNEPIEINKDQNW